MNEQGKMKEGAMKNRGVKYILGLRKKNETGAVIVMVAIV